MIDFPRPVIGYCAFSGTGKTTLLRRVLPLLRARQLRIAVVKHAHHDFELDTPGKDSHILRMAGAQHTLLASRNRLAWVEEHSHPIEPSLQQCLARLDPQRLDIVIVEGFKREPYPKIEVHRPSLGHPLLCLSDATVVAVATDGKLPGAGRRLPPVLELNCPETIVDFMLAHTGLAHRPGSAASRCLT